MTAPPAPPGPPAVEEPPLPEGMSRVDALFAGEPPRPPTPAGPVLRKLTWLLVFAIPLDALGILCWTGVPGAALTVWAWLVADAELARVEAGEYDAADAERLAGLRTLASLALGFCVLSLVVQIYLLNTPFYARIWEAMGSVLDAIGW